jgi:transcriptional regulator with XRE-family HTH domain
VTVRDRIAKLIDERGLKQNAVAKLAGYPDYWLSNRLTGRTVIQADEIPAIAAALGVSVVALFEDESESPSSTVDEVAEQRIHNIVQDAWGASMDELSPYRRRIVEMAFGLIDHAFSGVG